MKLQEANEKYRNKPVPEEAKRENLYYGRCVGFSIGCWMLLVSQREENKDMVTFVYKRTKSELGEL